MRRRISPDEQGPPPLSRRIPEKLRELIAAMAIPVRTPLREVAFPDTQLQH